MDEYSVFVRLDWVALVEQAEAGDPEPLVQMVRAFHDAARIFGKTRLEFADLPPAVQNFIIRQELSKPGRRGRRGYSAWFRTYVRLRYREILRLAKLSRRVGIVIRVHDRRGRRYELRPGVREKPSDAALRLLAADLCRSPETVRDIIYPRLKKPQPKS